MNFEYKFIGQIGLPKTIESIETISEVISKLGSNPTFLNGLTYTFIVLFYKNCGLEERGVIYIYKFKTRFDNKFPSVSSYKHTRGEYENLTDTFHVKKKCCRT